ncbi:Purine nucleoside phosphorylase [hydrothermal vent metagenome]|uniref:Purine nucleoside phosphorylase n=1 Tax=hydrothermal vent metagenome TaxID=652676 RepID=A0A1W1BA22_9ZZZZ
MKKKLLISSCLIGENVKYNGKNNLIDLTQLREKYELIPFCPEVAGGLPTPRPPSEIISTTPLKLINCQGEDVTDNFIKGAKKTVDLVKKEGIKKALLKANSPSCSSTFVYDGTFSGKLIKGKGVTTLFLEEIGVEVFDENSKFWL